MLNSLQHIKKTIETCLVFFAMANNIIAQSNGTTYFNFIKQSNESGTIPMKASMVNDLESPVNPLTGAACFDIPIYTIKAGNYSLPITMHYETSGFKVATIASNVGLGWNLNAGGCITKIVKGIRDNQPHVGYCAQDQYADSIHNYIVGLSEIDNLDDLQTPWDTSLCATLLRMTDNLFDAEPDIYSFNFAGYSGNFIYDMDNNIHLIPEQNFDIVRTNYGFLITVDNGDKYYFGEGTDNSSKEIVSYFYNCPLFWKVSDFERPLMDNFGLRYKFSENDREDGYCLSWYLTKIEPADSHQQIRLEYETDDVRTYLGTDETYLFSQHSLAINNPTLVQGHDWVIHRINRYKFSQIPRIRRITWHNGSIEFLPQSNYRKDLDYFAFQNPHESNIFGGHAINKITVSSSTDCLGYSEKYDIDLILDYFTDLNTIDMLTKSRNGYPFEYQSYYRRLRLDGIVFKDLERNTTFEYSFNYNRIDNLHCFSRNTSQTDYWGYFKPRIPEYYDFFIERYSIKPKLFYYQNGKDNPLYNSAYSVWKRSGNEEPDYVMQGNSDMTPDLAGSKEFTISMVHLPTGGTVKFDYELNDFHFDGQDRTGPGIRVKKVSYYDFPYSSYHELYKTVYTYKSNGHSSGRVSSIPSIGLQNMEPQFQGYATGISDSVRRNRLTARQFSTVTDMRFMSESAVQYEKITEMRFNNESSMGTTVFFHQMNMMAEDSALLVGTDKYVGKTKCKWTRILHLPDYPSLGPPFYSIQHIDDSPIFTSPIISWYNALLTKKEYYDDNNNLVASTEYKYSLKPSEDSILYIQSKYLCKYAAVWSVYDVYQLPHYDYPIYQYDILWGVNYYRTGVRQLDTVIFKYYDDVDNNLANMRTKIFDYNTINYVREEKTINSDGSEVKNTYTYPFEYANWHPNNVYSEMMNKNMLNFVVEQYTTVDNKTTQGSYCKYKALGTNNEFVKPEKLFKLRMDVPLTNFQPSNTQASQDSHYEMTNEIKFDPLSGNLVEVWDENDGNTTYVWGFNYCILLAKIQNATESEVRSALNCTMEALQGKTDTEELIGIFQALRTALPSAMVTSFTYDLFLNLVSITDPSGKIIRFEYDSALRLKLTRDVENNILQKHEYHYHQQTN